MSDLYAAAGGGGDPLGTCIAASVISPGTRSTIATYAWERLEVDPTPGPLGFRDFTRLATSAAGVFVGEATGALPPAGSTLPALAAELPARLLLLDPWQGVNALADQIRQALARGFEHVRIVDIGGDILTHGREDTLCSPLVDALTMAACHLAGAPATVYVAGPGVDGEIPQEELLGRLPGPALTVSADDVDTVAGALVWHPSEASALFAAAVHGVRGTVRTVERRLDLTEESARIHHLPLADAMAHNPVAQALAETRPGTLAEAADLSEKITGIHEINREHRPEGIAAPPKPKALPADAAQALGVIREAAGGAGHCTFRFAARQCGLAWRQIPALRSLLQARGPLLALHDRD